MLANIVHIVQHAILGGSPPFKAALLPYDFHLSRARLISIYSAAVGLCDYSDAQYKYLLTGWRLIHTGGWSRSVVA